MTKQQQKIAEFLAENVETASFATAQRIGAEIDVDPSTIVRFAQALGFQGFPDLQEAIRETFLRRRPVQIEVTNSSRFHAVVDREINNLDSLQERLDVAMLQRVAAAIAKAERTLVLASGSYSSIALLLEHLGRFIGYNVSFESRASWHSGVLLSQLTPDDMLIAITFWMGDHAITDAAVWAANRGIPLVAITDQRYSAFARCAKFLLSPPSQGSSFYSSITASVVIVYALLEALAEINPERSRDAITRAERIYRELGLNAP